MSADNIGKLELLYEALLKIVNANSHQVFYNEFQQTTFLSVDCGIKELTTPLYDQFVGLEFVCFVDISELIRTRASTGIQRVVKEFISRASRNKNIKIILFNYETRNFEIISDYEVSCFLLDVKNYRFQKTIPFDILATKCKKKIFFDIDSCWNAALMRTELYPKLKASGFMIMNFMYDFIPVMLPNVFADHTVQNFCRCLSAILSFSDIVVFDSNSAKYDFLTIKQNLNEGRYIDTSVVYLGNDFKPSVSDYDTKSFQVLDEKFILFVGTIEPRKRQDVMLDAFRVLSSKYDDLHLVFVGKQGWKVEEFVEKLNEHMAMNRKIHWLRDASDALLEQYYKKCFVSVYLSDYEGYGLPVAESLKYGNITITSDNSSLREVGYDFAEYICDNSLIDVIEKISKCIENNHYYLQKKSEIKNNFKKILWDDFFHKIEEKITKNGI